MIPKPWRPHVVLALMALLQLVVFVFMHQDDEAVLRAATDPDRPARERIAALHRLTNRATERDAFLGDQLVRELLASPDELLREYALTIDLCKHRNAPPGASPPLQDTYVYGNMPAVWTPHHLRAVVLYRRKVGGATVGGIRRLELPEARWFLDSLSDRPLPSEEITAYFLARGAEASAASSR